MIMPMSETAGTLYSYYGKPARVLGDGGRDVAKSFAPLVAIAVEETPTNWRVRTILERDFERDMVPMTRIDAAEQARAAHGAKEQA